MDLVDFIEIKSNVSNTYRETWPHLELHTETCCYLERHHEIIFIQHEIRPILLKWAAKHGSFPIAFNTIHGLCMYVCIILPSK